MRRGLRRERGRQAPSRHGLVRGRKIDFIHGLKAALHGNPPRRQPIGKRSPQKFDGKPVLSNAYVDINALENDLDHILHGGSLAKHIDPPFTELEDDFSRLKTQCIQLATLVLHLQNMLESEHTKYKAFPLEFSNTDKPKTAIVKSPRTKASQYSPNDPVSIVHPSSPNPLSGGRRLTQTPDSSKFPMTPGTALEAGSLKSVEMVSPSIIRLTPTLDRLLGELQEAFENRDGDRIAVDLQIEPPLAQAYLDLSKELQRHYPPGKDQHLRTLCERVLPKGADGVRNASESFANYLLQYLQFIRDYGSHNLLRNSNNIKILLKWVRHSSVPAVILADIFFSTSCICLGDSTFGMLILPSVVYLSKVMAKFALGLDKRPELVTQLLRENHPDDDEGITNKVSFIEDAANTIREAFIKCLSDKSGSSGYSRSGAPEGKRTGIYQTGNICLKLLFQCRKLSSATTMFASIDAQSPLLLHYPASQRVTYLYYLGRYHFANNHFFRAQLVLQAAYDQCHAQALQHRHLILVYLIASNICLGRFPSSKLLQRRETADLAEHFLPLCRLIASGDLSGYREYLSLRNPHGRWLLQKRLLLQLQNRCEILVWRSLARRVFIEAGFPGGEDNKTPFLRLSLLQAVAHWLYKKRSRPAIKQTAPNSLRWASSSQDNVVVQSYTNLENESCDSEFAGMEDAIVETGFNIVSGIYDGADDHHERKVRTNRVDAKHLKQDAHPTIEEVECIMASLIQQDLICGFLTHNNPRFAIPGAKAKGALAVGFPAVWEVIKGRERSTEVPGWVREDERGKIVVGGGSFGSLGGGGRVVNLSGARPVGVGAA